MRKIGLVAIFVALVSVGCSSQPEQFNSYESTRTAFIKTWEEMSEENQEHACRSLEFYGYEEMVAFFEESIPEGEEDHYSPEAIVDYLVEVCP